MQDPIPAAATAELHAAFLQALITFGLAVLCLFIHRRYRKPYFAWWTAAWGLYGIRIAMIVSFLLTGDWLWLYWHQVVTGWTALALLYAALVFSRGVRWRHWYLALVLFPAVWS
jgi:hypothetical protein